MQLTPRQVHRWAMRVLCVSTPAMLLILAAWAVRVIPADRPALVLMLYMLALSITLGAAVAAVGASCHLAVGRAFTAGMRAGGYHEVEGPAEPVLRLVD